ncbi:TPA: hypothetical protein HA238_05065 [Candidatus Micrarchaeota archaeon]|nr:hypothetical protein [Candidatus Micrarchaeota archaeon]
MLLEIFVGTIIIALALYGIWKFTEAPISFNNNISRGKNTLNIEAKRNIEYLVILDKIGKAQHISFVRRNIKSGETLEFTYPASHHTAKIVLECNNKTYEFEVI